MDNLLIVFLGYPKGSNLNLTPDGGVDKEKALKISNFLLDETLSHVRELDRSSIKTWIFYTPIQKEEEVRSLLPDFDAFYVQRGKNLGEKMFNALQLGFAKKAKRIVIIGTGCPELSSDLLNESFSRLISNDVVVGPALDGDYYLIGLCKLTPDIFQEIDWNSPEVLEQTLIRIRRTHLTYFLLPNLRNVKLSDHT